MESDILFMQRCIDLAYLGQRKVMPNPMVGAVIVHNNSIIGEGYHQKYGEAHAEVNAINSVENKELLKDSTIYVSLEPCAHFGKTPPCSDLIIKYKLKRVVVGCIDTFSEVAGKGIEKLKKAGIEVTVGVLEQECRNLNKRFFTFHEEKRPYIILKWTQTQDGFIDKLRAKNETGINWITSKETKSLVHQWRSEEHGILVGKTTVLNDDPSLTVRNIEGENPIRIVIDKNNSINYSNYNITNNESTTYILNKNREESKNKTHWIEIEDFNTENILAKLYELNIQSVIVEGGKFTLQQFIQENYWDEARVLVGNTIFSKGIEAPSINLQPNFSSTFFEDKIYFYYNKNFKK